MCCTCISLLQRKKPAAAAGASKKGGKSRFAAFKAQLQQKKQQDEPEVKTFDAGFFRVDSPVKTPTSTSALVLHILLNTCA